MSFLDISKINNNFLYACANGHISMVEDICEKSAYMRDKIINGYDAGLVFACKHGRLNIVMFLIEHFNMSREYITMCNNLVLRTAYEYDRLPIIQYLHSKYVFTIDDIDCCHDYILTKVYINGNFRVLQYLCDNYDMSQKSIIQSYLHKYITDVSVVTYLCDRFSYLIEEALIISATNGNTTIVSALLNIIRSKDNLHIEL